MLRELFPNQLWTIESPMSLGGLEIGARLLIARLRDGDLWVHSPFAISDEDETAILELGAVQSIVVPNNFHYTQVGDFARRFPSATVWAPPQLDKKLKDVPHRSLEEIPATWDADFVSVHFATRLYHEWAFVHRASRTLLLTDLLMNVPHPTTSLGRVAGRMLGVGGPIQPTRFERFMLRTGKPAELKNSLETVLSCDFERISMAHGDIIETDAKKVLERGFQWLLDG